jgi:hypothetical protein
LERIEEAILRTVLYADVFNFPLTDQEIHHFLIHDEPVSLEAIRQTLDTSKRLHSILICEAPYVACRERHDLMAIRLMREQASAKLWPVAVSYGMWLARLPFVRMVALTGALAVRNVPDDDDDLDYLLVTSPGRVWLARAFAIMLVRLARLRGVEVCPNFILAENKLEQSKRDIFMAHEVSQMVPLYGYDIYYKMREANGWSTDYLPNADGVFYPENERHIGSAWGLLKRSLEFFLGGRVGDVLERWEYRRKLKRFQPALQNPYSSARLDETQVKGHFNDNGHPALQKYYERLREFGLGEVVEQRVAGD